MQASDEIRGWIDEAALVEELSGLVRLETPSHAAAASALIASVLAEQWSALGSVTASPEEVGTHLRVDVPGVGSSSAPVLLLGHSDTVWPVGTLTGAVPLVVTPDEVRGPGAFDMKSGLVVMRGAVRALADLGLPHPPIRVVISADEEVGSRAAAPHVREAAAGVRCAFGFESPHPDGALKIGRLGSTRVLVKVTGREAHAALDPDKGIPAIDELVDQLVALRGRLQSVMATRPGEILVNVGGISGGGRANVIPGDAQALIGFRFATPDAEAAVMTEVRALTPIRPGAGLGVEVLSARPAWQASPGDASLLAEVASLAARAGVEVQGRTAAGAADTNITGSLGVPTLDGFGPRGGGAHAVSEHFLRQSFVERVALLATVLTGMA